MSKIDLQSIRKTLKKYTGEENDISYKPIHKIQFDLTREEFMSLFSPDIAVLREIELLVSEFSDQNYHFHVFFPESSLFDDQKDNKLWFRIMHNKITGVAFNSCEFVKEVVWEKIFSKLSKLKHLERVIIHNAKIKKLPNLISELRHVKRLLVEDSHVEELPDSIGNLVNLELLNLSHNSLKIIPESIGDMISLKEIYLWGNSLKQLPENIFTLEKLKKIYLERNLFVDHDGLLNRFKAQGVKAFF